MSEVDPHYLAAQLEFLGRQMDDLKVGQAKFEERIDLRLNALEKPLAEASAGFRLIRWLGFLIIAVATLVKTGDWSMFKSLF